MNTGLESRLNLERIVATLVKNLGDELFPSSVRMQLKPRDFAVDYVDISALRGFLEQRIENIRSVCSLSDLNDLISDGIRSAPGRISETCRLLQDVLSADTAAGVDDLYEGQRSSFLHGRLEMSRKSELINTTIRRRGLGETRRTASVSFHIVQLNFDHYASRHARWLAQDGVEASGCEWKQAAATSQRILLLTACRYRHAYHHLFAIMEPPETTFQSVVHTGCIGNMEFPAWTLAERFVPSRFVDLTLRFVSLDTLNTGIVVPTDDDTLATTSCAGVSRAFFRNGPSNPMERQLERDAKIVLFNSPNSPDLSADDDERPISVSQTSRLFFGIKQDGD